MRVLARTEARFDRFRARLRGREGRVVDPYLGYATPTEWIARGRVLNALPEVKQRSGVLASTWGMLSLFFTDEVADVTVQAVGVEAKAITDEEGYFTLVLPRQEGVGWQNVTVEVAGAQIELPVFVPNPDADYGVISDVDDTVMFTGAWQLWRNLWTTFTGSIGRREVFKDAIGLINALTKEGRNPVYYVSSSPWNLHSFLQMVLGEAGLTRGPMFLRDLGLNETDVLGGSHHGHKGAMIDLIFAANPALSFVMMGDTGQKDGAIYLEAAKRHEGRVSRVILRRAGGEAIEADVAGLIALGVQVDVVDSFDEVTP